MARAVIPHLPSHKLDNVTAHYRIPPATDRHRAMADVELTAQIFTRLLADGARAGCWQDLMSLDRVAGRAAPRPPAPRGAAPWASEVAS